MGALVLMLVEEEVLDVEDDAVAVVVFAGFDTVILLLPVAIELAESDTFTSIITSPMSLVVCGSRKTKLLLASELLNDADAMTLLASELRAKNEKR